MNVPPADDETGRTHVQEQENKKRDAHRLDDNLFVVAQQYGVKQLNTVSGIATDCSGTKAERATKLCNIAHKGKRGTDLSDLQQCVQRQKREALISQTCP